VVKKKSKWLFSSYMYVVEAAVKGDKQHATKQGDLKKDMTDLQHDTIDAVKEKERKGHLSDQDVGRNDTHEERVGSGSSNKKKR